MLAAADNGGQNIERGLNTCLLAYLLGLFAEQEELIIIDHRKLRSFPAPQAIATVTSWEKSPAWGVAQQAK
jgi:hypothetical protein